MHTIERTAYGLHIRIAGTNGAEQMEQYVRDLTAAMQGLGRGWHALIDLRDAKVLDGDAGGRAVGAQRAMREHGMERIGVILSSAIVALQNRRLAADAAGADAGSARQNPNLRVFNATENPDAERDAVAWVRDGIEPVTRSTPSAR